MITVTIRDDFDLSKIAASGQCFRAVPAGEGWRFVTGRRVLHIRRKSLRRYEVDCTRYVWKHYWMPYFDLERDYQAIRSALPPEDAYLCAAAQYGVGIRILRQDPWEMLITFIISQRKNIPAIRHCVETLCLRYGEPLSAGNEVIHAFPTPAALLTAGEEGLNRCSLGYRTGYLLDAARRVSDGRLSLTELDKMSDEELLQALCEVRGVGKKVADCVALFGYGRVNCAPVDVWIQRVIRQQYGGVNPFPRYGNAGILQQYLFHYAQTGADIQPK